MLKQKIKLMTDSVSDISKERAEALGIHLLYMPITVEGKALREELEAALAQLRAQSEASVTGVPTVAQSQSQPESRNGRKNKCYYD